jgi:hypothetical protein
MTGVTGRCLRRKKGEVVLRIVVNIFQVVKGTLIEGGKDIILPR